MQLFTGNVMSALANTHGNTPQQGLKDPKLVSDNIEKNVLAPLGVSKVQVQQEGFKGVLLTFELAGDELKNQREKIAEQCRQEAEKLKCIAELE